MSDTKVRTLEGGKGKRNIGSDENVLHPTFFFSTSI